jgi:hypothetical protein
MTSELEFARRSSARQTLFKRCSRGSVYALIIGESQTMPDTTPHTLALVRPLWERDIQP